MMTVIDTRSGADRAQLPGTHSAREWTAACALSSLVPGRGVAVLLPRTTIGREGQDAAANGPRGGAQVALFLLPDDRLFAVGNIDPFGRAAVMSRGLVGDRSGEPTVASPLLKQVFSLIDGRCLDDDTASLGSFETKIVDEVIFVRGAST